MGRGRFACRLRWDCVLSGRVPRPPPAFVLIAEVVRPAAFYLDEPLLRLLRFGWVAVATMSMEDEAASLDAATSGIDGVAPEDVDEDAFEDVAGDEDSTAICKLYK